MQRRPQNSTLTSWIDRLRQWLTGTPATPLGRRRRVPRYQIEARRQRLVRRGIAIVGALAVLILLVGIVNEYLIKPRQVLASVGGTNITRTDYWQVRAVDLWNQGAQYQQFAQMVDASLQPQYMQLAADAINQIPNVWGSTDVDPSTLRRMIDDQVYLQSLDELGLGISDQEVETYLLNLYASPDAPLITPTPTPTFIPARAAMATETAVAEAATPMATPESGEPATPVGNVAEVASPGASPMASPAATPLATIGPDQARSIAESNLASFERALFDEAHLTREDYARLIARPALAREKIDGAVAAEVGQSAEQVHAAHILVETQDLARELAEQLAGGADFGQLATEYSTDQGTAPNGGDLGWFTRTEMVEPFADVAFALEPEQISEPFQTEFGWHIVYVFAHDDDRPLSDQQITRLAQARVTQWLDERRAATEISSTLDPVPTPPTDRFQPPIEAPPLPTPTPIPDASPVGLPAATPQASPVGAP